MKTKTCPYCGSVRLTRSPSGEHLMCLGCHRIVVVARATTENDAPQGAESGGVESGLRG
jgi:hypothetical protein